MKKSRRHQRSLGLSDQEATSLHMVNQLRTEIQTLDKRIAQLQQDTQPDLDMVRHLSGLMHSRQSVLNWMQLRNNQL
ncbi:hypothetical protein KOI40_04445 [Aestuariicella sp. G3-2]|uniref:hypothetical protein n=1 Tax=Pseudomaricurvus albidus TaxID=2842452 RepID=UPI001C0E0914|nr:hypothetical protein [Aestuariicella albida]MBU3069057.1 hypothetical protein [Aestuariicella albida]